MLIANIEAQIEAKEKELHDVEDDILKIGKVIDNLKAQEKALLSKRADLIWKIEELKEDNE